MSSHIDDASFSNCSHDVSIPRLIWCRNKKPVNTYKKTLAELFVNVMHDIWNTETTKTVEEKSIVKW